MASRSLFLLRKAESPLDRFSPAARVHLVSCAHVLLRVPQTHQRRPSSALTQTLLPCGVRERSWGFAELKLLFRRLTRGFWRVDAFLKGLGLKIAKFIPLSASVKCSLTYF